jgi:hypothetical protein
MQRATPFLVAFLVLSLLGTLATALTVQPPSPVIFVNSGQVVPFLISLNTVNGEAYYAKISISAQSGLTASLNVSAYPSSGTSSTNVTVPVGITVSGNPGVHQLNISVVEYNSTSSPQSVLASYTYTTYVHIISPQSFPALSFSSLTMSEAQSVNIVVPPGTSGWYIKYKVLYPNTSVAQSFYSKMFSGSLPTINVSVTPSMTSGTTNATITFNVSVSTNLKFGEVPVTVIVYEYLNGTNALYSTQVLRFRFFVVPPNARGMFVGAPRFSNFTTVGHARFGNVSIMNSNMPANIINVVKGSNNVQILFNDSFTGIVSFQSNVTPSAVYADGQKLQEMFYTLPANLPLGTWADIGGTVYINADPSNVTVVYNTSTTTTTATSTGTTATSSGTSSSSSSGAVSPQVSSIKGQLTSFYEQHKSLVLITLAFLFVVVVVALLVRR